jgi:uncharacterized cupin superfamily protein
MAKTWQALTADNTAVTPGASRLYAVLITARGATAGDLVVFRNGTSATAPVLVPFVLEAANTSRFFPLASTLDPDGGLLFDTGIWYSTVGAGTVTTLVLVGS